MNHDYETKLTKVSVEVQSADANPDSQIKGFGLEFYERVRLSAEEFDVIGTLVRSADQAASHGETISFIKANVESAVCDTCQVDQSAKSMRDGNFRIWAGKSGAEQVVVFNRVNPKTEANYLQLAKMRDEDLLQRADSLLAAQALTQISQEDEAEAALYLSEFSCRHPKSSSKHAKEASKRLASVKEAKDDAYLDAKIDNKATRSQAQIVCRTMVERNLKAPSSADFQRYAEDGIEYKGKGMFRIRTKADALNSFGAKLRSTFECEVHCDAEENCIVTKMNEIQ